eukprot:SAG31_NODE_21063_length_558_cov_1.627451_1_plen_71_part_01
MPSSAAPAGGRLNDVPTTLPQAALGTVPKRAGSPHTGPRTDWSHVPIMYFSGVRNNRSDEEIAVMARFDVV